MTLVRILVDGYGLLDQWPELAPGRPRRSESAREDLIHTLIQYHDAEGIPITVVFDETDGTDMNVDLDSKAEIEVLFTRPGQSVRQMLQRLLAKARPQGNHLIVTDDFAESENAPDHGSPTSTCEDFMHKVKNSLADLEREIEQLNLRENQQFSHNG